MTTTPGVRLRIPQPNVPASVNALYGKHWSTRYKALHPWRDAARSWAREASGHPHLEHVRDHPCNVHVTLAFDSNHRRDPSNYVGSVVKAIVDGLVLAGWWPDDTPEWVTVIEPTLVVTEPVGIKTKYLPCTIHAYPREETQ